MTNFANWLDTFISEKGVNTETLLTVNGPSGENIISAEIVIEALKNAPVTEQDAIKSTFIKIDFMNGDILHFIKHLAQAIAI